MAINLLKDLKAGTKSYTVQLYVSRLWHHRGGTDDGPIRHTDIVFLDTKGDHIYGEISENLVDQFMGRIEEGKVYVLKSFLVGYQKRNYKPVEAEFIIRFGRYTTVQEVDGHLMDYPLCTYALTPLDELTAPVDHPFYFTDVVGVFTGVSPISQYHSATRATPSTKRVIYLSDISGFQVNVVLWGERAIAFDGEGVLKTAQTKPVVIIFVGTVVKQFEGKRSLSGGAPCRWYMNEDLPEINEILEQLDGKLPAIQGITLQGQSAAEISAQVDLETKTVKELVTHNTRDNRNNRYYCTITITKLSPGQRWWFHACKGCNHGTVPFGSAYKCGNPKCGDTGGTARYRLCYLASDGTDEFELVFFEQAGRDLIGKSALALIHSRAPRGMTLDDAIERAHADETIPKEISEVVSKKFRLVVSVTTRSLEPQAPTRPSYQVHRITVKYGADATAAAPAARRRTGLALASASTSSGAGLNVLGEALVDQLMADQTSSGITEPDASADPSYTETAGSLVVAQTPAPLTPPSVAKLLGPSGDKDVVNSSVKKALFQEPSPPDESENQLDSAGQNQIGLPLVGDAAAHSTAHNQIGLALVSDGAPPPATSTPAPVGKNNRSKPPLAKNQVDQQNKKKKT